MQKQLKDIQNLFESIDESYPDGAILEGFSIRVDAELEDVIKDIIRHESNEYFVSDVTCTEDDTVYIHCVNVGR